MSIDECWLLVTQPEEIGVDLDKETCEVGVMAIPGYVTDKFL